MADQTEMSHDTVRKALKIHTFHPHKMQIIYELQGDEYDRRMLWNHDLSSQCPNRLIYSSDENRNIFREGQHPQKGYG